MTQYDAEKFLNNFTGIIEESQNIAQELLEKSLEQDTPVLEMEDENAIGKAFTEAFSSLFANPSLLAEKQVELWGEYSELWQSTYKKIVGEEVDPVITVGRGDRRFNDESWEENAVFDFIKQLYLLNSKWTRDLVGGVDGVDKHTKAIVSFYTGQIMDALSPSNFLFTNPEVLQKAMDTNGESILKGLHNLYEDLQRGKISMTDFNQFKVGENLACTKGNVIFQNDMMQLIQYAPTTKTVYEVPLLIVPAWINKYYILDLSEKNSFVKWLVDQGFTVFMISWKNPDESMADKEFEDYLFDGPIAAMDAIEKAIGAKQVNTMGYCLGGTLLNITSAYLAKKGDKRIKSNTFLTTLTDFSDVGDLSVFIDEDQIQALEEKMNIKGYLDADEMALTFAMLRANDLIWPYVVNNYLLGKDPFPFDILFWNSDSTRLPAKMHSFYLRNMYMQNNLVKHGKIKIDGVGIDLRNIDTPSYMLSTKKDHIAPWESTYAATQLYKGATKFVLAHSGHIAGIINHPSKNKYCHWINHDLPKDSEDWFDGSDEIAGSWWTDWVEWNAPHSGKKISARKLSDGKLKKIEAAPGEYVKQQY